MYDKPTLRQWAEYSWKAFTEVGGTMDMFIAGQYKNEAQAYYAGEVWAFNRCLYGLGQDQALPDGHVIDFEELDKEYAEYL